MHADDLGHRYVAGECCDVWGSRMGNNGFGCSDLFEHTVFHHSNPVTEPQRLIEVMGDEHDGATLFGLETQQLVLHVVADERVERRKWLIEEQDLGVKGKCAGQAYTLLHASRQLIRVMVCPTVQPDKRENFAGL